MTGFFRSYVCAIECIVVCSVHCTLRRRDLTERPFIIIICRVVSTRVVSHSTGCVCVRALAAASTECTSTKLRKTRPQTAVTSPFDIKLFYIISQSRTRANGGSAHTHTHRQSFRLQCVLSFPYSMWHAELLQTAKCGTMISLRALCVARKTVHLRTSPPDRPPSHSWPPVALPSATIPIGRSAIL